jgi:class 3 adenylate cyclase
MLKIYCFKIGRNESFRSKNLMKMSNGGHEAILPSSSFDDACKKDFTDEENMYTFQASALICLVGGIFFSFVGMRDHLSHDHPLKSVVFWLDQFYGSVFVAFAVVLALKITRPLASKWFDVILVFLIASNYSCQMFPHIVDEFYHSLTDNGVSSVQLKINYSGSWPVRKCNDSDPLETWTSLAMRSPFISCNNSLFSGDVLSKLISISFSTPLLLQFDHKTATYLTIVLGVMFTVAGILLGSGWGVAFPLTVQLAMGMVAIHCCYVRVNLAKQSFLIVKRTQLTAERNRALIHTFIPQNVLQRLTVQEGPEPDAMLSSSIPYCTVMFCCLEPQEELQVTPTENFVRLMNSIFSQFDEQVEQYGMFKYQHVGDWYIVACPRAACPFDRQEQEKPYPPQHLANMVLLADALRAIAETHRLRQTPLWLRAGIHSGPLVGAVVGLIKAFYCLYGDTVNTAARMCKYAGRDHILASAAFADALRPTLPACIRCEEKQEIVVKGKGVVITCRLTVSRRTSFSLRALSNVKDSQDCSSRDNGQKLGKWGMLWDWVRVPFQEASLEDLTQVTADDMSAEGRMIARRKGYRLWPMCCCFRDSEIERRFLADSSVEQRVSVTGGILIFLLLAALHLQQCAFPEHPFDFYANGLHELAVSHGRMLAILAVHLGLSAVYCTAMIATLWLNPTWSSQCRRHFTVARVMYLAASMLAWWVFPGMWRWNICFSVNVVNMLDITSPSMRTRWCAAVE